MTAPEFDRFADSYDKDLQQALDVTGEDKNYFSRGRMKWLGGRVRRAGRRPRTVLDFGCGTGTATPFIFEFLNAESVVGADVSPASLECAVRMFDTENTRFADPDSLRASSIDLAFCNGVFHHIPPDQRQSSLLKVHDSLRPGAWFALFENNPWNPATYYVMSRCVFDRDAITLSPIETRRRMRQAGFQILETRFLFIFPAALKALRFLERPLSAVPLGGQYVVLGRKLPD
jgi:SAM-dependent methyltransferase